MSFEGPEKKFELLRKPGQAPLRALPTEFWRSVVSAADASILSSIENEYCAAYLLSESSLFVFDDRVVMITCGRTRLVNAVHKLMSQISRESVLSFIYERKNENYPELQPTTFEQDIQELQKIFPGSTVSFDSSSATQVAQRRSFVSIFGYEQTFTPCEADTTLELLMHDISPEVCRLFCQTPTDRQLFGTWREGLEQIFPEFLIDEYHFKPAGYSLNAIREDAYYTIHVTPHEQCSYVSFETNFLLSSDEVPGLVQQLVRLFKPGYFDLVAFHENLHGLPTIDGYLKTSDYFQRLGCGYQVYYAHLETQAAHEVSAQSKLSSKAKSKTPSKKSREQIRTQISKGEPAHDV